MSTVSPWHPHQLWAPGEQPVVLDVRSPREYAQGHVPGAFSLPLFSDEARAQVGITYKQQGHHAAVRQGLALVGPHLADYVAQAEALAPLGAPLWLYCWRGGMRSGSMAWLLATAGYTVSTLLGGYKAYRAAVRQVLAQSRPYTVLTGGTGCGKTALLAALSCAGAQVLDLEALAHHRGSAFGSLGMPPQPTQEHFENVVAHHLAALDAQQPVWVEDESRTIGRLAVPPELWQHLEQAPRAEVTAHRLARVDYLVQEYGAQPPEALAQALQQLRKRMGGLLNQQALAALAAGDLHTTANLLLDYYDGCYAVSRARTPAVTVARIHVGAPGLPTAAEAQALLAAAYATSLG